MAIVKTLSCETFLKCYYKVSDIIKREYSDREIINMIDWLIASLPINDIVLLYTSDINNLISGSNTIELINYINNNVITCLRTYNNERLKAIKEYEWVTIMQTNFFRLILLENSNEARYYL